MSTINRISTAKQQQQKHPTRAQDKAERPYIPRHSRQTLGWCAQARSAPRSSAQCLWAWTWTRQSGRPACLWIPVARDNSPIEWVQTPNKLNGLPQRWSTLVSPFWGLFNCTPPHPPHLWTCPPHKEPFQESSAHKWFPSWSFLSRCWIIMSINIVCQHLYCHNVHATLSNVKYSNKQKH